MTEKQILAAATEVISTFGDSASRVTAHKVNYYESQGFHSVAKAWRLIGEVVRDTQETDAIKGDVHRSLVAEVMEDRD